MQYRQNLNVPSVEKKTLTIHDSLQSQHITFVLLKSQDRTSKHICLKLKLQLQATKVFLLRCPVNLYKPSQGFVRNQTLSN
jgi:hypothetical protein